MVKSSHEAMHRIFQECPDLFAGVSKVLDLPFVPPRSVTVLPTDLTEARPVERRVDTLLRFDYDGDGSFLVAVEAQSAKDPDKPASWAYYLSFLYTKYKIPPLLLVVCQDRPTAEWAARSVPIGPEQWTSLTLHPLVVGPHNMPVIADPDEARADPALAALSVITHAKEAVVDGILKALSTALLDVPEAVAGTIIEFTAQGIGGNRRAAEIWRNLVAVDLSFYKSYISEEIRDEGRTQGRVQRGAEDVLLVLEARGLDVSEGLRERITACDDPDLLRIWLTRAATAASAGDIFTEPQGDA
ncbi:hypothetical protein [Streptomyces sp. DSM 15324]|uniref:hypothetical protein n=1 Tax=Streptomyces sp. DSM 15324 TaxID=1739111 RepID=UPI00074A6A72|nr:hypothetical protein [Streptomyces sp. DSM 15324]KUO11752.1 hypothetical protein AQJ58_11325 [Streptomyces sp. DSM 15324]